MIQRLRKMLMKNNAIKNNSDFSVTQLILIWVVLRFILAFSKRVRGHSLKIKGF